MKRLSALLLALAVAGCTTRVSEPGAPLIGVSCSRYGSAAILPTTYTDAITRAGGIPVILPTVSTEDEALLLMGRLDGVLFSGGEDVSPSYYGEEVLNETVEVDAVRDRSDSLLARAALACGTPVLAICRGSQLMNVILGGSLYQDIPTQLPDNTGHSDIRHKISVGQGSVLESIYGPDSLQVLSLHHQCVKDLGEGITVTSRSADGIVEAWEAPGVWAVQFHPEKMLAEGDDSWLDLFSAYVRLAAKQRPE